MKHTHTIHTDLFMVAVIGNTTEYVGHRTQLYNLPDNAGHYTQENAEDVMEAMQDKYPSCKVEMQPVTEEKTTTDLYEAVADTLNNANGWDYQHCGRSRYEDATEMVSNLENHDFTAKEVSKFVKDFMAETETPPTIKDIAIGVADRVGAMITLNRYEDLTFHVNIR